MSGPISRRTGSAVAPLLLVLSIGSACAASACDDVLSYFLYPHRSSSSHPVEWHLYDPDAQRDRVFLTSAGGFADVRWDTSYRHVWFVSGKTLYRAPWKLRAAAKAIGRMPDVRGRAAWWLNPDSLVWQLAALRPVGPRSASRYRRELWQANEKGTRWRRLRADTVTCEEGDCGAWPWADRAFARRAPLVRLEDLAAARAADSAGEAVAFDTSSVTVRGPDPNSEWQFMPSRTEPSHGVAFRTSASRVDLVSGPFYYVDLPRQLKRPLGDSVEGWMSATITEHCGLMLLPGSPVLIESRSGRVLVSQRSGGVPVWARRPR